MPFPPPDPIIFSFDLLGGIVLSPYAGMVYLQPLVFLWAH